MVARSLVCTPTVVQPDSAATNTTLGSHFPVRAAPGSSPGSSRTVSPSPGASCATIRPVCGGRVRPLTAAQPAQPRRGVFPPLQHLHQRRADHHPVDVPAQPLDLLTAADAETGAHRDWGGV